MTYQNGKKIDLDADKVARNKAVNDYSIVVQEFFVKRTEDWLNTVGKKVLGIEHYWVRFEFAKGRGQIHAHLLAILRKDIMSKLQRRLKNKNNNTPQYEAQVIAEWAEEQFGMTANMPSSGERSDDSNEGSDVARDK